VPLIFCHDRLQGGKLGHLMAVRLGILALQSVVTAVALLGFDRDHDLHRLDGHQGPALALMARLPPTAPATGYAAWSLRQRLGGSTRWQSRGIVRVLLETL
jgi:hypothetical protein